VPQIIQKPIGQCGFWGQLYYPLWFVVHFTGGTPNLQSLYDYWVSQCDIGSNSHFGIERYDNAYAKAGDIWQFLPLTGGAAANCCLEYGHAPFFQDGINYNVRTISVECINPDSGNRGAMPDAQYNSLVYLIQTVCQQMGIPTDKYYTYNNGYETTHTFGDENGGLAMHRDFDPISRQWCPGEPYYNGQMDSIMIDVNGGSSGMGANPEYLKKFDSRDLEWWLYHRWCAFYDRLNEGRTPETKLTIPRANTGIYNYYRDLQMEGIDLGGVMCDEYQMRWHMLQDFTGGQISWDGRDHSTDHTGR